MSVKSKVNAKLNEDIEERLMDQVKKKPLVEETQSLSVKHLPSVPSSFRTPTRAVLNSELPVQQTLKGES